MASEFPQTPDNKQSASTETLVVNNNKIWLVQSFVYTSLICCLCKKMIIAPSLFLHLKENKIWRACDEKELRSSVSV